MLRTLSWRICIDVFKMLYCFFLCHASGCSHAAQFMEDCTIDPQTFFFQILFDGRTCCHLAAIHETNELLTIMQVNLILVFWFSLCHLVKSRRSNQTGDKVWCHTKLLQFLGIFLIQLYKVWVVLILLGLLGELCPTIWALALGISNDMPSRTWRIVRSYIDHSVTLDNIGNIIVKLCITAVRCAKNVERLIGVLRIIKVKHVTVIHRDGLEGNTIIKFHFLGYGYIFTTMLTTAHLQ